MVKYILRILVLAWLSVSPFALSAQIPNPDLEYWNTVVAEKPNLWRTYGNTIKVAGKYGNWAVKLMRNPNQPSSPGAVLYGNPDQDFEGGVPFIGHPDSAIGYFKTNLSVGDSAWFIVVLRSNGKMLSTNLFKLHGVDTGSFRRWAFKLDYQDTGIADSLSIGVSSTDPEKGFVGSWVIADSLHFSGGSSTAVPNSGFENWSSITYNSPIGWYSSNEATMDVTSMPVSRTTDAALHSYAAKITNVKSMDGTWVPGYIMAGKQGQNGPLPGFEVSGKDSVLYVNYKCFPAGGDTLNIAAFMYDSGQMVGVGILSQWRTINSYSLESIPIRYFNGYTGTPDSGMVFAASFQGGKDPKGASVLYVDGFKFNQAMTGVRRINSGSSFSFLNISPNPTGNSATINFPAVKGEKITIGLYTVNGILVKQIVDDEFSTGIHSTPVSLADIAPGMYLVQYSSPGGRYSKKLVKE